jgi:putative membrane protein
VLLRRLLITWLVNCLGIVVASAIIDSISYGHDLGTLLLAGLILAVVNVALRPLLILMTLPVVILTLGLGLVLINALMLWLTSKIVHGFHVGGFWSTVGGAIILSLVNLALRPWTHRGQNKTRWTISVQRGRGADRPPTGRRY